MRAGRKIVFTPDSPAEKKVRQKRWLATPGMSSGEEQVARTKMTAIQMAFSSR